VILIDGKMTDRLNIKEHSQEMALLGEKSALLKHLNNIQTDIHRVDSKLRNIEHKRTVRILKESGHEISNK